MRERRENAPARRDQVVGVKVSPEEKLQLKARAVVKGVTVPRLLFESAMNARIEIDAERQAAARELLTIRRELQGIATNLNQLARYANTEDSFPVEAAAAMADYQRLAPLLDEVAEELMRG